jgi:hypothetical protein
MKLLSRYSAFIAASVSLVSASPVLAQPADAGKPEIILHRPNPHFAAIPTAGSTGVVKPAIRHNGGPVMGGTPNVYVIWYGNWANASGSDTPAGQSIVTDFLHTIGGSPYFNINQSYSTSSSGAGLITGLVNYAGQATVAYPYGVALSDAQIQQVVADAINGNQLPKDSNGLYFVLTSSDVTASSGFCTQYCGWHTHGTIGGTDIKYSFVGNAQRCLSSCASQLSGPNGNAGVDGMISVLVHELEEAVTDPDLNAWFDSRGYENADKCAWTFGTSYIAPNGAYANVQLGARHYLIQRNLVRRNGGNYCVMAP